MKRIPNGSWSSEVLVSKALMHARLMEGDPQVADLAPGMREVAERLASIAGEAAKARNAERESRMDLEAARDALDEALRTVELLARAGVNGHRSSPEYQAVFPEGLSALGACKRDAYVRRVATVAKALAKVAGLEDKAKGLGDLAAAETTAQAAWMAAKDAVREAEEAKRQSKKSVVTEFRVHLAVIRGRLRNWTKADAFFPDLEPAGNASGAEPETAPATKEAAAVPPPSVPVVPS